jgi:hypothetical protein
MASSTIEQAKYAAVGGLIGCVAGFGLHMLWESLSRTDAGEEDVSTTGVSKSGHSLYETDKAVSEYLLFHFQDQVDTFCPYSCAPKDAMNFAKR